MQEECIQQDPIPFPQEPTIEEQELTSSPPIQPQSKDTNSDDNEQNDKIKLEEEDDKNSNSSSSTQTSSTPSNTIKSISISLPTSKEINCDKSPSSNPAPCFNEV